MIHAPLEQAGGYQGLLQERQVYPPVAKLDIAADSDSEGRGFESLRAGHDKYTNLCLLKYRFVAFIRTIQHILCQRL
jgi:hypothetical protein